MISRASLSGLRTVVADEILCVPPEVYVGRRPQSIYDQFLRVPSGIAVYGASGWSDVDDDHVPGVASMLRWGGHGRSARAWGQSEETNIFLQRRSVVSQGTTVIRQQLLWGDNETFIRRDLGRTARTFGAFCVDEPPPWRGRQGVAGEQGLRGRPVLAEQDPPPPWRGRQGVAGEQGLRGRPAFCGDDPPPPWRGRQGVAGEDGARGRSVFAEVEPPASWRGVPGQRGVRGLALVENLGEPWPARSQTVYKSQALLQEESFVCNSRVVQQQTQWLLAEDQTVLLQRHCDNTAPRCWAPAEEAWNLCKSSGPKYERHFALEGDVNLFVQHPPGPKKGHSTHEFSDNLEWPGRRGLQGRQGRQVVADNDVILQHKRQVCVHNVLIDQYDTPARGHRGAQGRAGTHHWHEPDRDLCFPRLTHRSLNIQIIPELYEVILKTRPVKGDKGDQGDKGDKGDPGDSIQGPPGEKGDSGKDAVPIPGPRGERGPPGWTIPIPLPPLPGLPFGGPGAARGRRGEKGDQGEKGEKGEKGDPARDPKDGRPGRNPTPLPQLPPFGAGRGRPGRDGRPGAPIIYHEPQHVYQRHLTQEQRHCTFLEKHDFFVSQRTTEQHQHHSHTRLEPQTDFHTHRHQHTKHVTPTFLEKNDFFVSQRFSETHAHHTHFETTQNYAWHKHTTQVQRHSLYLQPPEQYFAIPLSQISALTRRLEALEQEVQTRLPTIVRLQGDFRMLLQGNAHFLVQ